ncbi:MAG: phosphotransacetylase family protein [Actinobacteria bacterium]|nr:phosphotransacetylase family protein [Actinomycetota bacterium]
MVTLYIVSIEAFSGKTGLSLALGLELKERGFKVGYMKPVGTLPLRIDGGVTDRDAQFVCSMLETGGIEPCITPIVLTQGFVHERFRGGGDGSFERIKESFEAVSRDKDVVVLEGGEDPSEGRFVDASAFRIAEEFNAKVLLVAKFRSELIVDDILLAADGFKDRLFGVAFNMVPRSKRHLFDMIEPYLEGRGIKTFGILPRDHMLISVSVGELASELNGTILTAKNKTSDLVETLMVGAMGQEKALRFFQRSANKAVITGGDRADVQLAALETPTKCLILTGNLEPSPLVLGRAEELGVPVILVEHDTLTTVSISESLVGTVRVHQQSKVDRFRELVKENFDIDGMLSAFQLSNK